MMELLWHQESLTPDEVLELVRNAQLNDEELKPSTQLDLYYVVRRDYDDPDWHTNIKGQIPFENRICISELEGFLTAKPEARFVTINVWKTKMVPKNYDVTLWDGRESERRCRESLGPGEVCNGCGYRNS